jgi:protein involved in polysaccharide export with SLBB domain
MNWPLRCSTKPDLSLDKIPVDTSGRVQVPLVGSVKVADMTPDQASKVIEAALGAKFLRDPKVTVNVTTMGERLVSVEGQVTKAGLSGGTRYDAALGHLDGAKPHPHCQAG